VGNSQFNATSELVRGILFPTNLTSCFAQAQDTVLFSFRIRFLACRSWFSLKTRTLVILFLACGLLLFFVHLGVFVYLYLPAALVFVIIMFFRSRRTGKQKAMMECPRCGSQLASYPDRERYCPNCGEPLEESIMEGGFFKKMEYPLSNRHKILRRIFGFCCLGWIMAFSTVALMAFGVYAVAPVVIITFFHPFVLLCLLIGIYHLRASRGNRKASLIMLILGTGGLVFLLSSVLKPGSLGSERDLYLFAIQWGSMLLAILNGLTCVEKTSKKLSAVAVAAACLTAATLLCPTTLIAYNQIACDIWNQWCTPFLMLSIITTVVASFIAVATTLISLKLK